MDWARILAHVTGTVDQELLARNEYLAAENRIMSQVQGRCREGEHGRQIRTDHPSETDAGGGTNCQPAGRRYRGGARRPSGGRDVQRGLALPRLFCGSTDAVKQLPSGMPAKRPILATAIRRFSSLQSAMVKKTRLPLASLISIE
jgi:hypothetical protein